MKNKLREILWPLIRLPLVISSYFDKKNTLKEKSKIIDFCPTCNSTITGGDLFSGRAEYLLCDDCKGKYSNISKGHFATS